MPSSFLSLFQASVYSQFHRPTLPFCRLPAHPITFRLPHTPTLLTLQYLTLPEVCWVSCPEDWLRALRSPMAQVSASQMQSITTIPEGAPPKFRLWSCLMRFPTVEG